MMDFRIVITLVQLVVKVGRVYSIIIRRVFSIRLVVSSNFLFAR